MVYVDIARLCWSIEQFLHQQVLNVQVLQKIFSC